MRDRPAQLSATRASWKSPTINLNLPNAQAAPFTHHENQP
ncbi:MAG: hypothetical protein GIKADHBN_02302 [Phycisphaerales bacterium]|nr:hypothetical protein [Phycisphaerales bacterium]